MPNNLRVGVELFDNIPEFKSRMESALRSLQTDWEKFGREGTGGGLRRSLSEAKGLIGEIRKEMASMTLDPGGTDSRKWAQMTRAAEGYEAAVNKIARSYRLLKAEQQGLRQGTADVLGGGGRLSTRQMGLGAGLQLREITDRFNRNLRQGIGI